MKQFVKFTSIILLFAFFISCKKGDNDPPLTPAQQQQVEEERAVLLPNEILEQEGIRFKLNYSTNDAQIVLKLYKGTGSGKSPISLIVDQEFINYSITTDQLEENSDFTVVVEYNSVTNAGSFDLSVIGYTSINSSKAFTITGSSFTTANMGTKKDFLKISKGITKYNFSTL